MGKELWGSGSIGEQTERQKESMKSKKKVSLRIRNKKKYYF
jgi:ribosomal protein S30